MPPDEKEAWIVVGPAMAKQMQLVEEKKNRATIQIFTTKTTTSNQNFCFVTKILIALGFQKEKIVLTSGKRKCVPNFGRW